MQSHIIFSFINKGNIVTFLALSVLVILCAGCGRQKKEAFTQTVYAQDMSSCSSQDSSEDAGETTDREDPVHKQVCVFVCGAVKNEGVYFLSEGSRVIDAVNAAGGYREDADRVYVNQAEYVYDAERVMIPTIEEAQALKATVGEAIQDPGQVSGQSGKSLININTASRSELMQIPGIGESKAERIIAYRENHGRFGSVEEIRNVSGIGDGIYEGLKDYITVE